MLGASDRGLHRKGSPRLRARSLHDEEIQSRAIVSIVNESLLVLEDGIAAHSSDIDLILTHG
jgi:hypothetical protein